MPPGTRTRTNKHVRGVLSMTTDEIAAAVQAGQAARLDLWVAVRRFAYRKAHRWSRAIGGRSGVELEDLMQVAFLALVEALGTWRPEDGAFLTWYGLRLKSAFTEATGQRTQRDRLDPLDMAFSLDAPLTDSESGEPFTLADTIEDKRAAASFADIEERDRLDRLHAAMMAALSALTAEQRASVVGYFIHGQKTDAKARNAGLRVLRNPAISRTLRVFL